MLHLINTTLFKLKRIALLFSIVLLFFPQAIFSQTSTDTTTRKKIIKLYPLQLFGNREYVLGYEQTLNNRYSIELIAGVYKNDLYNTGEDGALGIRPVKGIEINVHAKKYFKKYPAPKGFHHGLLLKYKYQDFENLTLGYQSVEYNINVYQHVGSLNYVIGKNFVFLKHISLDVYTGLGIKYKYNVEKINYKIEYRYSPGEKYEYFLYENTGIERTLYYQNRREINKGFIPNFVLDLSLGYLF